MRGGGEGTGEKGVGRGDEKARIGAVSELE